MSDTIVSVVGIVAVVGIGFGCYAVACISPPVTKWLDMARPKESDQPIVPKEPTKQMRATTDGKQVLFTRWDNTEAYRAMLEASPFKEGGGGV
jgi:hypothetical protein